MLIKNAMSIRKGISFPGGECLVNYVFSLHDIIRRDASVNDVDGGSLYARFYGQFVLPESKSYAIRRLRVKGEATLLARLKPRLAFR